MGRHDFEGAEDKELHVSTINSETEKAYGVKDSHGVIQWLPKSQVTMKRRLPNGYTFTVPAWLAAQKDTLEFDD